MHGRYLKAANIGRGTYMLICILAFSRHNFLTEGFIENPRVKNCEKPKINP